MSKTKKTVIVFSILAAMCIIGTCIVVGIFFSNGNDFSSFLNIFGANRIKISEKEDLDLNGVTGISVNCSSADITIEQSKKAYVTLIGEVIAPDEQRQYLNIFEENGTIYIEADQGTLFFGLYSEIKMVIYLPENSGLDMQIVNQSGHLDIRNQQLGDISAICTSGSLTIESCTGETMKTEVTSGQTQINKADFQSIHTVCRSGDINIADTSADLFVQDTSGNINIKDAAGRLGVSLTSGSAVIDLNQQKIMPIDIDITSGNVQFYLNPDASFNLAAGVTSGWINTDFTVSVSGEKLSSFSGQNISGTCNGGGENINITVVSGNIDISAK